jgi:hypothetical protein
MKLSARALNRTTLKRQLLLRRTRLTVPEAVRRVVAIQAQAPASPYLALWNRVAGFDPADLDAAFADREVVKATSIRITLHAVLAEDYPHFHTAMTPALRGSRLSDRRFTSTGLSAADVDGVLAEVLEYAAQPRTVQELERMLADRLGRHEPRVWWALRTLAPLWHAPVGPPWSFGQRPAFIASGAAPVDPEASVQHLIRRYLEGFGPASARDFTQFAILPRRLTESAWDALSDYLVEVEGPDGEQLFDAPGGPYADEGAAAPPRLLGMWDSVLLAYADRGRVIPPDYRSVVIRRNGDVLPTLLIDGYVAGVWRPVEGGIEATAFHPLNDDTWSALAGEARRLIAFLADREPNVYSRYGHWWAQLPKGIVRVLPG